MLGGCLPGLAYLAFRSIIRPKVWEDCVRIAPIVIADLVSTPAVALNCSEAVIYRQVTEGVTGWNQILPVAP